MKAFFKGLGIFIVGFLMTAAIGLVALALVPDEQWQRLTVWGGR